MVVLSLRYVTHGGTCRVKSKEQCVWSVRSNTLYVRTMMHSEVQLVHMVVCQILLGTVSLVLNTEVVCRVKSKEQCGCGASEATAVARGRATPPEVSWTGAFAQCCPPSWTLDHELWYKVWCSEEW